MKTNEEVQNWTIFNESSGKVYYVNDIEFKNLIDTKGLILEGQYITINLYHNHAKVWIDAILKGEYYE